VAKAVLPDQVRHLFWEVSPGDVDLERHRDYVLERVMSRGGWDAMRWLRATYRRSAIADFLRRRGERLTPRDRAYWSLIAGVADSQSPGGGRPNWAG
jgi:squalene cyclase